jgi:hypothetical protein
MNIGYWGVPGTERVTIVHIQYNGQCTLCGYTMSDKYEFQWCARMVDRVLVHRYVECQGCKKTMLRLLDKEAEIAETKVQKKREKKKRNRATDMRDMKEAAIVAHRYMNMARCVGGHVIASGLMCPHCESYDPPRECHKEKIKP